MLKTKINVDALPKVDLPDTLKRTRARERISKIFSDHIMLPSESDKLRDTANGCHKVIKFKSKTAIRYARLAGDAFLTVKKKLKHSQFTTWLDAFYDGSRESARGYMRVAKYWNHPDVKEVRMSEEATLSKVLKEISRIKSGMPKPPKPKDGDDVRYRKELRAEFCEMLKWMEAEEVEVCLDGWGLLKRHIKEETKKWVREQREKKKKKTKKSTKADSEKDATPALAGA